MTPEGHHLNNTRLLWVLATIKFILFSSTSFWTCWTAATSQIDFTVLSQWDQFQIVGGCIAAWLITMIAFIDRSASQISHGKIPGLEENGNSETKP